MGEILVINAGSSSIKVAVLGMDMSQRASGMVSEIGGTGELRVGSARQPVAAADHGAAFAALLGALEEIGFGLDGFAAAGHRVVHGGRKLTRPLLVDEAVLAEIAACVPLAPLHNPHNLSAIRALREVAPDLPQVAVFDTGFHANNPEVALRYALPDAEDRKGIRRYGFHGISYESLVERY